jgi:TonB family protein
MNPMKLKQYSSCYLLAITVILSSCDSEPPPPPPPGPEAARYNDVVAEPLELVDNYIGPEDEMIETIPYWNEEHIREGQTYIGINESDSQPRISNEFIEEITINENVGKGDLNYSYPKRGEYGIVEQGDYVPCEAMPEYPGGEQALKEEIQTRIIYPKREKRKRITGTVLVRFAVEKDGTISNVRVEKGVDDGPGLSEEAVRAVVALEKKFIPAKIDGHPVKISMTYPVEFKLR